MRNRGYHFQKIQACGPVRRGRMDLACLVRITGVLLVCLLARLNTHSQGSLSIRESVCGLTHARQASCVREDGQGDAEAATIACCFLDFLLLLLDKWNMAAYPSGDPIGVLLVAYLHLTTTPAGEVQCRPSRASILRHAGLESSPSR